MLIDGAADKADAEKYPLQAVQIMAPGKYRIRTNRADERAKSIHIKFPNCKWGTSLSPIIANGPAENMTAHCCARYLWLFFVIL